MRSLLKKTTEIRMRIKAGIISMNEKSKTFWLSVLSFVESSFFPIPPDPFLMIATVNNPVKWKKYAFYTSLFSVLGGIFGYFIGFYFFDLFGKALIQFYSLEVSFEKIKTIFETGSFMAIFLAAFTPVPYKIFTIASGFFGINLFIFIIASIFGRSIRFFAVSFLMKVFGERFGQRLIRIIDILLILLVIFILAYTLISIFK